MLNGTDFVILSHDEVRILVEALQEVHKLGEGAKEFYLRLAHLDALSLFQSMCSAVAQKEE